MGKVSFQLTKLPNQPCDDPTLEEWRAILRHLISAVERRGLSYSVFDQPWAPLKDGAITIFSHQMESGRGIWNVKKSYIPHYVYFDRTGYSGWAEIANIEALFRESQRVPLKKAEAFFKLLQKDYVDANVSKWEQSDEIFKTPHKPYIFYPLQRPSDTVMRLAHMDWLTLLHALVAYAERHHIMLVVKRHPRCDEQIVEETLARYKDHPNVMRTDAGIHSIIKNASGVFVVNSGVGFESLMQLKPVFTAGKCDYHWVTHTLTKSEQIAALAWPLKLPVPEKAIKKFLYYFCTRYLVDVRDGTRTDEMVALAIREYRYGRTLAKMIGCCLPSTYA